MDANHDTDEGEQGLAGQPAPPAVGDSPTDAPSHVDEADMDYRVVNEDFLPVAAYEEEAAEYSVENRSDENGSDEGDLRLQDAADHVGDAVPLAEGENGNDDVNLDTSRSYSDEEELSSSDSWDSPYHDEDDDDDESSYTSYSLIIPENLTNHDDLWNPDPSFGYYSDGKDLSQCALPDRPYGDASYVEGLRLWALETGQSEESLNLLLAHTKQHNPQYNLPQEARAFINKPGSNKAKTEVMRIIRGQLWYQGIEKCLRLSISNITTSECTLMLDFFVDRLRLSNSSQNQMWILLMKICSVPEAPAMTVAIYYGKSKPVHIDEFLGPFVSEINELQSNDFTHQSFTYEVVFRAFKTDPTAHAFVLGLRSRSLHGLCMRCTIASKRCKNRVYFPYCTERSPRTDAQFRMSTYMLENNVQYTPLLQMHNLNFITDFVVSGKMYLTDRGIAAQLMFLWTRGFPGVQCKLTARQQHKVSKHLRQLALPSDFRRSLRDLKFVHVWKAVEYKVFLEIVGFVVLKGRLSNAAYRHFMLLFVAITILSTPHHSGKYHEAETLLERFVAEYGLVYSQELVNSNVHSLLHVFEDVERYGSLRTLSSSPFEAKMRDIKKLIRSGSNSFAQVASSIEELQQVDFARISNSASEVQQSVRTIGRDTIAQIRPGFVLRKNFNDQWCMTHSNKVVRYEMATMTGDNMELQGYTFTSQIPAFTEPLNSEEVHMFSANVKDLNEEDLQNFATSQIMCKVAAVKTENEGEYTFVPLPLTYLAFNEG